MARDLHYFLGRAYVLNDSEFTSLLGSPHAYGRYWGKENMCPTFTAYTTVTVMQPSGEKFKPLESGGAKENLDDGSIWEKDTSSHGGEQWKRWPNKKSWEKGETPTSVWPDGRVRK